MLRSFCLLDANMYFHRIIVMVNDLRDFLTWPSEEPATTPHLSPPNFKTWLSWETPSAQPLPWMVLSRAGPLAEAAGGPGQVCSQDHALAICPALGCLRDFLKSLLGKKKGFHQDSQHSKFKCVKNPDSSGKIVWRVLKKLKRITVGSSMWLKKQQLEQA